MLLTLARWIHSTELSALLAASTWAYPVIGGLHVLGLAWFGGAVLFAALDRRDREPRLLPAMLWTGGVMMLLTGALLFVIEPLLCAGSKSFHMKLLLLVALAATSKVHSKFMAPVTLTLWAGVILASRGIAFF